MTGKTFRFEEIAESITERVDDPTAAGVDRYVGLEHLDPETTHISRWGSPGDVQATKLRFYPGDVIYGRRRAYQRKLGVAQFDGICSAHALVLRARPETCLPGFLPYFLHSDRFHTRALEISVGSLSPTINWTTLRSQEFELPSLDEQAHLVELISEIDEQITRIEALIESGNRVVGAIIDDSLYKVSSPWSMSDLDEVCKDGLFKDGDWVESKDQDPAGENRLLQLADIGTLKFLDKSNRWMNNEQFKRLRCTELLEKDVLIARMPDPIGRACLMPSGQPRSATVVDVSIARPDQSIVIPEYLVLAVNGPKFHQAVVTNTVGTTRPRIARSKLGKIEFPLPPLAEQISIVDRVDEAMAQIEKAETARLATISLRTSLINSELS